MKEGNADIVRQALDLHSLNYNFTTKPLVIGGLAMEYYDLRKRGEDIDLIITNADYQSLAKLYPNNKKDIWGDLGIVVNGYEIWRCIQLLDYDFYSHGAFEYDTFKVISFERLFFMRVIAMKHEKYQRDLQLMIERCFEYRNTDYLAYARQHIDTYKRVPGGVVFNEEYQI